MMMMNDDDDDNICEESWLPSYIRINQFFICQLPYSIRDVAIAFAIDIRDEMSNPIQFKR